MNLRILSETSGTVTLGWDAIPGAVGFSSGVDNTQVSHTMDGTRTTIKFGKPDSSPHNYWVQELVVGDVGALTVPAPPAPPPPPATGAWPLPSLRTPSLFVSPTGSSTAAGTETSPMSLAAAKASVNPGDCVGLLPGTYPVKDNGFISRSGTAAAWIQWRNWKGEAILKAAGGSSGYRAFVPSAGVGYHDFRGITFDGTGDPKYYEALQGNSRSHHIIVAYCRVIGMGAAGIVTSPNTDHVWAVGNDIWRFGDGTAGWAEGSSGISFNAPASDGWLYDQAPGFHKIIVGNRVCGGIDLSNADADGNGIILDIGGNIGPALIANNLIYMNGGRGSMALRITSPVYIVNNTVWRNGLDVRKAWYELGAQASTNVTLANNIAVGSSHSRPFWALDGAVLHGYKNAGVGGMPNSGFTPDFTADPKFAWVPTFADGSDQQWKVAPKPWELPANAFRLSSSSPYLASGLDPTELVGLDAAMKTQMAAWAGVDPNGVARGAGCSLGAYEGAA